MVVRFSGCVRPWLLHASQVQRPQLAGVQHSRHSGNDSRDSTLLAQVWERLDEEVATTPMPHEYRNWQVIKPNGEVEDADLAHTHELRRKGAYVMLIGDAERSLVLY